MSSPLVRKEIHGAVGEIVLDNPPLNLVTIDLLRTLREVVKELRAADGLRAVVVHAAGTRAFCAGSDMREFEEVRSAAAERKILPENHLLRDLATLPFPTIAAIEAPALGGGLELALACDLRIVGERATFGLPESRIGGLASNGSQRLTRLVGPARAKELLFLGDPIDATEAERIGLVNRVVEPGGALAVAREMAAATADRAPLSVRLAKSLVDAATDTSLDAGVTLGIEAQERIFASADLLEGATAFQEKRAPRFVGR